MRRDHRFVVVWAVIVVGMLLLATSRYSSADVLPATLAAPHPTTARAAAFAEIDLPPLILPTPEEVAATRRAVEADMSIAEVFRREILEPANEALKRHPRPIEQIVYEGRVSGDPERNRSIAHLQDMHDIRRLCWAAVVTGERRYSDAAIQWTMAWVRTLPPSGNDVNDNKLDAIVLATYLLRDQMSEEQRKACIAWCHSLGKMQADGFDDAGGNRLAKRIKLVAAAALITDDRMLLDAAANRFRQFISTELRPDGGSHDLELRDALSYHCSALKSMIEANMVLRRAGVDLYEYEAPTGASLAKSIALVTPYAMGEKEHKEWVNTKVDLDRRRWEAGDPYYRPGKLWEPGTARPLYVLAATCDPSLRRVLTHLDAAGTNTRSWEEILLQFRKP